MCSVYHPNKYMVLHYQMSKIVEQYILLSEDIDVKVE